ncbi:MAG: hypothetical protein OHK0029_21610 [Armatimonadaceae bacterium]
MANEDTIQMPPNPAPRPAGGAPKRNGRVYSSLPEDNLSNRIGIALAVSLGANFLVLYGASVLANNNTITPPNRPEFIKDLDIELRDPLASPTPVATPTPDAVQPTPTPEPERVTRPEPTPQPNRVIPTPEPRDIPTPIPTPVSRENPRPAATPIPQPTPEVSRPVPTPNPEQFKPKTDVNKPITTETTIKNNTTANTVANTRSENRTARVTENITTERVETNEAVNPNVARESNVTAAGTAGAGKTTTSPGAAKATENSAITGVTSETRDVSSTVNTSTRTPRATGVAGGGPSTSNAAADVAVDPAAIGRDANLPNVAAARGSVAGKVGGTGAVKATADATNMNLEAGSRTGAAGAAGSGPVARTRAGSGGPAGNLNPLTSAVTVESSATGISRQDRTVAASVGRVSGRPKLITMSADAARVTETDNIVPAGGAVRAGQAVAKLGGSLTSTRGAKVAGTVESGSATYDVSVTAPNAARGAAPSVKGNTAQARGKVVAGSIASGGAKSAGGIAADAPSGARGGSASGPLSATTRTGGVAGGDPTVAARDGMGKLGSGAGTGGGIRGGGDLANVGDGKGTGARGKTATGLGLGGGKTGNGDAPLGVPGGKERGGAGVGNVGVKVGGGGGGPATSGGGPKAVSGVPDGVGEGGGPVSGGGGGPIGTTRIENEDADKRESDKPAEISVSRVVIPESLRSETFTANIRAEFKIPAKGRHSVTLVKGSGNAQIDNYVLAQLRGWRTKPAERNGKPIDSERTVSITLQVN